MFEMHQSFAKSLLSILLYTALTTSVFAPPYGYDSVNLLPNSTIKTAIIHTDSKYDVWPVITAWINVSYVGTDGLQNTTAMREVGRFGTGLIGSFQGWLHRSVPIDGCTQILNNVQDHPWIAFVKRGGCTFSNKAKWSIQAGANGMIVYSYNEKPVVTMDIEESSFSTAMLPLDYATPINVALDDDIDVWMSVTVGRNLTVNNAVNTAHNSRKSITVLLICLCLTLRACKEMEWHS
ncbi:RING finger protein 150-like [Saccoglossus kowalevskii]|uniref:Protein goliath-like n=1 Tax=Saccoglossus kowalevskii TaxID=10224 RepID=A0ABM0GKN2_SACKO|nr:PREDICTED: protein goliath-like [Saccoglossus kowalevskii]